MVGEPEAHFTRGKLRRQQLNVTCDGGQSVSDAGLLAVRALHEPRGAIAGLAEPLADRRSPGDREHSVEALPANGSTAHKQELGATRGEFSALTEGTEMGNKRWGRR
jgi:hypothetical protein